MPENSRAELVSHPFQPGYGTNNDCEMVFYYHMYGSDVGQLRVELVTGGAPVTLWQLEGDQGNLWYRQYLKVENSTQGEDYIILLVGNVKRKDGGDIAIDDVVFSYNCILKNTAPNTTPEPTSLENCDFETDMCGWNIDAELNATSTFEFKRTMGVQHSDSGDGPSVDHNNRPDKFFLWANAKDGKAKSLTSISSPVVLPFKKVCFEFFYDMSHGSGIKYLQVAVEEKGQGERTVVWQLTTTDEFWEFGRVKVEMLQNYKIILSVERGEEGVGYIGLDDFFFTIDSEDACSTLPPGAVPKPPTTPSSPAPTLSHEQFTNCAFEDSECGWTLNRDSSFIWIRTDREGLPQGYDGPTEDHNGFFLYAAAAGGNSGDSSTISTASGNEAKGCLNFYFNIWHEGGIRALKIRTQDPDGYVEYIWDLTDFTMESNEEWWVGEVNFSTHQLVFEATHGDNSTQSGYVAIDDVFFDFSPNNVNCDVLPPEAVVTPTEFPPTGKSTTSSSSSDPQFCNFENDLCNWNIEEGLNDTDTFIFKRTRGDLQDGINGPTHNHDTTETSYFLWASAASGTPDTQTALTSPQYSTTKKFCFTFWFDLTVSKL